MKILVTGSNGFVGSRLVEDLARAGHEVTALARNANKTAHLAFDGVKTAIGDVTDIPSLEAAVKDQDVIIHCAGLTAAKDREAFFRVNAMGTANLAEAAANHTPSLKKFILVSSLAAAGPALKNEPKSEVDEEHPVSLYGESKLEGERVLKKYFSTFPVLIVRPPIVYGPRDRGVFEIIKSVNRRMAPCISGSNETGEKFFSVVHVGDLSKGIQLLMNASGTSSGDIFYFSEDRVYTYREILSSISTALKKRVLKFVLPMPVVVLTAGSLTLLGRATGKTFPLNWDKLNELKPDYWICSPKKAKQVLGFESEYDLSQGMHSTIQWYKENQWL